MTTKQRLAAVLFLAAAPLNQGFAESAMTKSEPDKVVSQPTTGGEPSVQPQPQQEGPIKDEKPTKASPEAAHDLFQMIKSASDKKAGEKK